MPSAVVGQASVGVKFKRQHSVLLAAVDVRERSMKDKGVVGAKLREVGFPADHVVVSDVLIASSLTVLVSGASGEQVTLHVAVPVGTPVGMAEIAGGLGYSGSGASSFAIVGAPRMTPLYRLMKLPPSGFLDNLKDGLASWISGGGPARFAYLKVLNDAPGELTLGQSFEVQPQPAQKISISSRKGEQITLGVDHWGPLRIEPIVDRGLDALDIPALASPAQIGTTRQPHRGSLKVNLDDGIPLLLEHPDGQRTLARPLGPVRIHVSDAHLKMLPSKPTASVEYVDFDVAFAAASAEEP